MLMGVTSGPKVMMGDDDGQEPSHRPACVEPAVLTEI